MADASDVLNSLVTKIVGFTYPSGTGQPSITGKAVNVFPGWPLPSQIESDMATGIVDVSVFPMANERNVTRYAPRPHVMSIVAATLTLKAQGSTVTVGGAMPSTFTPHNLGVLIAGTAFLYAVQPTDTLTSIAAGLAALIAASWPGTTSTGPVITVGSGGIPQTVRVGTIGTTAIEWERQVQGFQITTWASDPTSRTLVSNAIKVGLAPIAFLTMPDGFGARIQYQRSFLSDDAQKAQVYRRDLFYDVEYATTVEQQSATVVTLKADYQTPTGQGIVIVDS